jgi:hypothetical protein
MIIRITGRIGQTRTEPERAEVAVGETVQWSIEVTGGTRTARSVAWEIYFQGKGPFNQLSYRATTEVVVPRTDPPQQDVGVHVGKIDAGKAEEPGEYKYGVRAIDEATRHALSDDDPHIIVRRRPR